MENIVTIEGARLPSSTFSISVIDDFRSIFPMGVLIVNDSSGILEEAMLFSRGLEVVVNKDFEDGETFEYTFKINKSTTYENETMSTLGSFVKVELVHPDFYEQEKLNKGFSGEISTVLTDVIADFNVESSTLEATEGDEKLWFQTQERNTEFIERLRNFSSLAGSPYLSYITSLNDYYFQSVSTTVNQPSIAVLALASSESISDADVAVFTVYVNHLGGIDLQEESKIERSKLLPDGTIEMEEILYPDMASDSGEIILSTPMEKVGAKQFSIYEFPLFDQVEPDQLFPEQLTLITQQTPSLVAGMVIELLIDTHGADEDVEQSRHSGNYTIMRSEHISDDRVESHKSRLLVGRQSGIIYSDNTIKGKLWMK